MKARNVITAFFFMAMAVCVSAQAIVKHLDFRGTPICGSLKSFTLPGYEEIDPEGKYEKVFTKGGHKVYVDFYTSANMDKKAYNIVEEYPHSTSWAEVKKTYRAVVDSLATVYEKVSSTETGDIGGRRGVYFATLKDTKEGRGSVLVAIDGDRENPRGEAYVKVAYFDKEGNDWVKAHK